MTKKQSKTARSNNKNQCHQYQSLEILRNTPMLQRFDLLFLFDPAIVASPTCPSEQKQPCTEIRCQLSESKDVYRFSTYGRLLNIPRSSFICIIVCATLKYVHMLYQSIVRNKGGKRIRQKHITSHHQTKLRANSIIHERPMLCSHVTECSLTL